MADGEAVDIVGLVARTMNRIDATNHWDDGHGDSLTAFTARVGDDPVDGVVREHRDAHGALVHITLFLRPLRTLKEAIEHIKPLRRQHSSPTHHS